MASAYVQKAWFITLECGQQSISFPALLIKNQGFIENLEQNGPESQKIETVTSFGVAQRDCFFSVLVYVLRYPFPASYTFFLDFSVGKFLQYNKWLSRIETENINSTKNITSL